MSGKPTYEELEHRVRELEQRESEKKLAEKALQDSHNMLQTVLDSIPSAVFWKDRDLNYIGANRAFMDTVGLKSSEDFIGKSDYDLPWEKEQADSFREDDRMVIESGTPKYGIIESYQRAEGSPAWARTNKVPLRDEDGNIAGVLGTNEDITELIHSEKRLEIERDTAQRYLDLAGVIFVALDKKGEVTLINPKGCEVLGYNKKEIIGKNWFDNFMPEWLKEDLIPVSKKLLNGDIKAAEYHENPILTKKGEERLIAWHNTILKDNEGKIIGHLSSGEDITARKRAEEALRESEEKFREIFRQSPIAIELYDSKGLLIEANPQCLKLFGVKDLDEVIGFRLFEDPNLPHNAKEDLLLGNQVYYEHKFDFDLLKAKGLYETSRSGKAFINVYINPLYYFNNKLSGYLVQIEEITDRKRAEKALQDSHNMLQTILDSIPSAVFWKDRDLNYIGANRVFIETVGLKLSEDVVGKSDYDFPWEKEQADSFREDDRMVIESGTPKYSIVESYQRADGFSAWARTNKVPLRDNDGNITGVLGTYEDITELTEALEASLVSEKKFRSIFENSSDGIVLADIETKELMNSNQRFCEMFGYDIKEITRLRVEDIHPRQDLSHVTKIFERQARGEVALAGDMPCLRKDGTTFYADISTTNTYIHGRKYIIGFFRDITERRRMNDELVKAEKLESLGILAGGIAHDFNNILTTILGNVSLAKDEADPKSETFELLDEAEKASRKAQALTMQLLTFAKGGAPLKETASLGDIIKESSIFTTRGAKSDCEFSIAKDLWPVEADVGQISQVINNIVINANQAMPEGGVIHITAENKSVSKPNQLNLVPGKYVRIRIKDYGIGIDIMHLSKIFDPFFTTKQNGSGLGLSTAYSIIKNHGGIITLESKLGVGTTFHIYLPASEKETRKKRKEKIIKGRGRILLMDDEAPLRKIAEKMLDKLGYEPEFAKNGDEVIRMVKEAKEANKPYDAVILDLTVPGGMGGKEAIQKLLEIDPKIKAIVTSGYSDNPVLTNFKEYGFMSMIPKPFESLSLSKVLHKVLKDEKG